MGNYLIEQKMGLVNEDLEKEMLKNQEMKRRMRQRMVDKNAAKKARLEEQRQRGIGKSESGVVNDAIRKAKRNQQMMPPENFK